MSHVAHFTRLESLRPAFSFCTSQQATTIALKEGIEIDLTILRLRPTWLLQRTELDIGKCVCDMFASEQSS